jgi:DNA-binding transcriptional regulator YiaG
MAYLAIPLTIGIVNAKIDCSRRYGGMMDKAEIEGLFEQLETATRSKSKKDSARTIKEIREGVLKINGVTEFAYKIGAAPLTVMRWESGKCLPRFHNVRKMKELVVVEEDPEFYTIELILEVATAYSFDELNRVISILKPEGSTVKFTVKKFEMRPGK